MGKYVNLLKKGKPPWESPSIQWKNPDGAYAMTEVKTQWDFQLEGYYLAHCLGTKNAAEFLVAHRVFSLRDKLGYPHATILLLKEGAYSPYEASHDLLTDHTLKLKVPFGSKTRDQRYRVLQVRGRTDDIARWEYYSIVRDWFAAHGGRFPRSHPRGDVKRAVLKMQDTDVKYHYAYMLDESVNYFNWAHWNSDMARKLAALGLVNL